MDKFRLKFPKGKQGEFLDKVIDKSKLNSKKLAKILNISRKTFDDWRREKFTIPYKAAKKLSEKFAVKIVLPTEVLRQNWEIATSEAGRKGGVACYKKHGNFSTPEGCRKGGLKSIKKRLGELLKPFYEPRPSADLAEFIGILLGDGGLTKEQWSITQNSIVDIEYVRFLIDFVQKLFKFKPGLYRRKDCNALVICGSGKKSIEFFTKTGLRIGNKVKQQVGIPEWIKDNKKFKVACLRGLMDTDGGVFRHFYWVNGKRYNYLKICFTNRSLPILQFVFETLKENGFNPKFFTKLESKKVWLYNQHEVGSYLKKIGSHNPRLLKYWKVSRTAQGMVC